MNKKALSLAICMAMALPTASNALSLGEIESKSSLNQPFQGRINLLSTTAAEAKSLKVRVASAEVFNRVGIDRPAFLNSIRFRTTIQNGRPVILVSSNQPINEPFLNFLLEVSWPNGQLLKEYTVLLDPPVLMRPNTAIASNNAGVRAEPRAQGRITRPVAQQRRTAPARRQTPQQVRQQQQLQRQARATQQKRAQEQRQLLAAQRKFAAEDASTASRTTRTTTSSYRVRRGDTLSKVANKLGYSGVRKDQMMVALFEKNRRAFSQKNMNNLKSGALMARPSLQEARATKSRAARAQVLAQAKAWKKARIASAKRSGSKTAAAAKSARIEVVGTTKTIDKGEQTGTGSVADLNKQLGLLSESLTTKQKENDELKSKVSELESLLRNKNRLITLKSEQLAGLQASMKQGSGETPATVTAETETPEVASTEAPVVASAEAPEVANVGTDIQQEVANTLANENGEIIRAETDPVIENIEPKTVEVEPANEEPASPFTNNSEEKGFDVMSLLEDPRALGVGGGSLLALLGGLWYMRRRKNNEYLDTEVIIGDGTEVDEVDEDDEDDFETSTQVEESELFDDSEMFDESEFVAHDEVETAEVDTVKAEVEEESELDDIIQETDVYIVYGLHDQAESEIRRAIKEHPGNAALHAKLLENYQAAGDKEAFEKEAKAYMDLKSDDKDEYWGDICEWGKALVPESKMFDNPEEAGQDGGISGAAAAAVATGVAMVAGTAIADDAESDADTSSNESIDEVVAETASEEFEKIDIDIDVEDGLEDFDFDNVLNEDSNTTDIDDEFDINFDGGDDFDKTLSDDSIDINLDSGDVEMPELVGELDIEADLDSSNLSLDLDSDDFDKLMPEDHAYKATDKVEEVEESLEELTAELKEDDLEDNLLADFDDNLSFLDLDNDSDVIEETQIETKIDLAKAYIDMGDIDGARSTLEEVIEEGSEDQKREAEELLQHNG